ncbi:MAG: class I poly(R)-hydroxyalkanoic acid synthase [Betaproteobacteria bacterium]|nr:class I poly(R)-hydroxyalkanoic acid synthase [Betaproteobacteria bacterium]
MYSPFFPSSDPALQAGPSVVTGLLQWLSRGSDADISRRFADWSTRSARAGELYSAHYQRTATLWQTMFARSRGAEQDSVVQPDPGDRRFAAAEWREDAYFDFLKQSYLLNARFLIELIEAAEIEPRAKRQLRFYARQFIDATSPANFAATNPEVMRLARETNGETITRGTQNLLGDVVKGRISTTDESAFGVGKNLAATPGAVVFENELIQLIQYKPATETVRGRPLVIVPPCINKFYVLDLTRENSFVRYAVEQGNTVFLVSWRNVTAELGHLTWDDYIRDGVIRALEVARVISKADKVNALGFCVGGTLIATALAVLVARGEEWAESLTLLTTLLDYAEAGEIGLFVDEASVAAKEAEIGAGGIMEGRNLAFVFSMLRANDLVWSYVVNNYLKGRAPDAFDILYWNADSTNLPGPMYCWYVRNTYLENRLREPGALRTCDQQVDLGELRMPVYILATREDHIVPWKAAYASTRLLKGRARFVLGASGHIAGVVNPAAKNRRSYWTSEILTESPEPWLAGAREVKGSWWNDWNAWLAQHAGGEKPAPKRLGGGKYKRIENAPGRYVQFRVV